jgi:hypothetical protein
MPEGSAGILFKAPQMSMKPTLPLSQTFPARQLSRSLEPFLFPWLEDAERRALCQQYHKGVSVQKTGTLLSYR